MSKKRVINIGLILLLSFVVYQYVGSYSSGSKFEGKKVQPFQLRTISGEKISSETIKPPYAMLFWSKNCPPCILELARYNSSIADGDVPKEKVITVAFGDDSETIKRFMKKKEWIFNVYFDFAGEASMQFNVVSTPTAIFVDKSGKISWYGTGISPFSIMRLEKLFK